MDEASKDKFIDQVFPTICNQVKEKFEPLAVTWASEAWIRSVKKEDVETVKEFNWKNLPIEKEALIISIETETQKEVIFFEIKREGKQITDDGSIVDKIILEPISDLLLPDQVGGRFSNLFLKLK